MKLKPIIIIVIFAFLIGGAIYTAQIDNKQAENKGTSNLKSGLKEGSIAPNFTLNTLDGKQISLKDYRGKKVILNFWATWCPPCKEEIPEMMRFYKEYHTKNVEILAVNLAFTETKPQKIKDFVRDYGMTFPIPLDEKNTINKQFRAVSIPTSYFINEKGMVKSRHVGPMDYDFMKKEINEMQ
ncbi:redoxin domain-containing protein [Bacillus sp. NEB1478]|uniref:TlpA disulfide reductase family protein n=1 Tax=Bacillus sp. NEB1478 TaxID=3073816 RepID=UPI002872FFFE|nr:redoxin domain-containing protein [Bacillus sp. NEB1478]WNB91378.1 redoxin domain-containing protein [Bacillus sp. NEB1478]